MSAELEKIHNFHCKGTLDVPAPPPPPEVEEEENGDCPPPPCPPELEDNSVDDVKEWLDKQLFKFVPKNGFRPTHLSAVVDSWATDPPDSYAHVHMIIEAVVAKKEYCGCSNKCECNCRKELVEIARFPILNGSPCCFGDMDKIIEPPKEEEGEENELIEYEGDILLTEGMVTEITLDDGENLITDPIDASTAEGQEAIKNILESNLDGTTVTVSFSEGTLSVNVNNVAAATDIKINTTTLERKASKTKTPTTKAAKPEPSDPCGCTGCKECGCTDNTDGPIAHSCVSEHDMKCKSFPRLNDCAIVGIRFETSDPNVTATLENLQLAITAL